MRLNVSSLPSHKPSESLFFSYRFRFSITALFCVVISKDFVSPFLIHFLATSMFLECNIVSLSLEVSIKFFSPISVCLLFVVFLSVLIL